MCTLELLMRFTTSLIFWWTSVLDLYVPVKMILVASSIPSTSQVLPFREVGMGSQVSQCVVSPRTVDLGWGLLRMDYLCILPRVQASHSKSLTSLLENLTPVAFPSLMVWRRFTLICPSLSCQITKDSFAESAVSKRLS
jgi:hypothetical protein